MLYGAHQRIGKTDKISLQWNCIELEEVKEYKYLGLLFDPTVMLKNYADQLCAQISKHFGIFKWVRDYLIKDVWTMMYNALILPWLEYCDIVIGNGNASVVSASTK